MGACAEAEIGNYKEYFNGQCIVEIGCGGSTKVLADIANENNQTLIAIDPTRPYLAHQIPNITYVGDMLGEEYLENEFPKLNMTISAAYLDNFDWIWNPEEVRQSGTDSFAIQRQEYTDRGEVLHNTNSSMIHLIQTMIIEKYSADKCVILFDDTWFDPSQDIYFGKGSASIIWLLAKGWKVVFETGTSEKSAVMLQKG